MNSLDPYSQLDYRCRLEWGIGGAMKAGRRKDIVVIVDVLSFSTTTAIACDRGGIIVPAADADEEKRLGRELGYEVAVARREVPQNGRYSLSPQSFIDSLPTRPIVLSSPNGAAATLASSLGGTVVIGALVNASAAAELVKRFLADDAGAATLVACGERWIEPPADGRIRFALEDFIGAGAVAAVIGVELSPEAQAAAAVYEGLESHLAEVVGNCGSANELRAIGYERDVEIALSVDSVRSAPICKNGVIRSIPSPGCSAVRLRS